MIITIRLVASLFLFFICLIRLCSNRATDQIGEIRWPSALEPAPEATAVEQHVSLGRLELCPLESLWRMRPVPVW